MALLELAGLGITVADQRPISGLDLTITSGNGDTVTLDHSGTNTLVNGVAVPDSSFSFIDLQVGSLFGPGVNNVNVRAIGYA